MSFRISIVCEDHTLDQFLVKPIFEAMLRSLGKNNGRVVVVSDPRLQGISNLWDQACPILARYGPISNAVVYVVDADGKDGSDGNPSRATKLTNHLSKCEKHVEKAVVISGIQEIEVWGLWGSRTELADPWSVVRSEIHPKEVYFDKLTTDMDLRAPGKGRQRLVKRSLESGWQSLKAGCPELEELEGKLKGL